MSLASRVVDPVHVVCHFASEPRTSVVCSSQFFNQVAVRVLGATCNQSSCQLELGCDTSFEYLADLRLGCFRCTSGARVGSITGISAFSFWKPAHMHVWLCVSVLPGTGLPGTRVGAADSSSHIADFHHSEFVFLLPGRSCWLARRLR